jgi:NitT/TauT family transport system ATP-binding protein
MDNNILIVNNLGKTYQTINEEIKAVDNFSLSLKDGELLSIVGPSGCGKSTILSILCGLETDYDGSIKLSDGKTLGYMLQQDSLFEWLTILDNCLLGLKINHTLDNNTKQYVINLLNTYGLKDFINSYPSCLSGGMRQRVALIRTLATKPDILLLDEPFSALDSQSRLAVSDDVYRIIKKEHKSAIMVTHDLAEAISFSDRVIVLSERPCHIKNIHTINLTNASTPIKNRECKEFNNYYNLIWKELDFHV